MASLSAELERTFVRLWTHCDDEGRCEDRIKLLKAALYPLHDDITPESLHQEMTSLQRAGVIIRYSEGENRYIQVVSWGEYQHPQKPRPSKYPAPPVELLERARKRTGQVVKKHASGVGVGEGVGNGKGDGVSTSPAAQDDAFEQFWISYPKRNGKRLGKNKAQAQWKRLSDEEKQSALAAASHYASACDRDLTIAKDAFRWLRDREFEDWQTPAQKAQALSPAEVGRGPVPAYTNGDKDPDCEHGSPMCAACRQKNIARVRELAASVVKSA